MLVPFFLFWVFFQLGALLVPGAMRRNDLPEVGVKSFKERVCVCAGAAGAPASDGSPPAPAARNTTRICAQI